MNIVILGASGWIGQYLAGSLQSVYPEVQMTGTYRCGDVSPPCTPLHLNLSEPGNALAKINKYRPDILINLIRDETRYGSELHETCVALSTDRAHYVYLSSSSVFDGAPESQHYEEDATTPNTDYGRFKARCERSLMEHGGSYTIVRFSAIHGHDRRAIRRTESLLRRLKRGEPVTVDTGIVQNRLYVEDLCDDLALLASHKAQGIFHLGTEDSSEEIDFLRRVAEEFGHDPNVIIPGKPVQRNLVVFPGKIKRHSERARSEEDTIKRLGRCRGLQQYKKTT